MKTKIKRIWWTVYEVSYRQPVWKLTINKRLCSRQFVISYVQQSMQVTPTLQPTVQVSSSKKIITDHSQTTSLLDGAQGSLGSDIAEQLNSWISAVSVGTTPPIDALDFWAQQQHQYPKLVPHA